jgi:SAM-dependent methyltransferase
MEPNEVIDHELLAEQQAYYRARAGEYDEWFRREGRYDRGPEHTARWAAEVREVAAALDRFRPAGRVLELACGTGWWTERLLDHATTITAVDASPEVLARNRARLGPSGVARVRYVQADLFEWRADALYDVVFFSFWLSHVPPARFNAFWAMVRDALAPGGRVFLIDSRRDDMSSARDHVLPDSEETTHRRRLNDGREFRVVKVFYEPEALSRSLATLGWTARAAITPTYFLYAEAAPASTPSARSISSSVT